MARPDDLQVACDLALFRFDVRPLREVFNDFLKIQLMFHHHQDKENKYGGRFQLELSKKPREASKCWEALLLAILGSQFDVPNDEICGAVGTLDVKFANLDQVVRVRPSKNILTLWTKHADDNELKDKVQANIRALGLPNGFEYKRHRPANVISFEEEDEEEVEKGSFL